MGAVFKILKIFGFSLKDVLLSMVAKIAFKAIGERFATRAVLYGLEYLRDNSGNYVVQATLDDVIKSLSGKKLAVVEDYKRADGGKL